MNKTMVKKINQNIYIYLILILLTLTECNVSENNENLGNSSQKISDTILFVKWNYSQLENVNYVLDDKADMVQNYDSTLFVFDRLETKKDMFVYEVKLAEQEKERIMYKLRLPKSTMDEIDEYGFMLNQYNFKTKEGTVILIHLALASCSYYLDDLYFIDKDLTIHKYDFTIEGFILNQIGYFSNQDELLLADTYNGVLKFYSIKNGFKNFKCDYELVRQQIESSNFELFFTPDTTLCKGIKIGRK